MRIWFELTGDDLGALIDAAVREHRPVVMQAQVMLLRALGTFRGDDPQGTPNGDDAGAMLDSVPTQDGRVQSA